MGDGVKGFAKVNVINDMHCSPALRKLPLKNQLFFALQHRSLWDPAKQTPEQGEICFHECKSSNAICPADFL